MACWKAKKCAHPFLGSCKGKCKGKGKVGNTDSSEGRYCIKKKKTDNNRSSHAFAWFGRW